MRRRNRPSPQPGRSEPPRDPPPSDDLPYVVLISSGLALYLACLWLGVVVIDDTLPRSALMSALIVAIAAVGYAFTHPSRPSGR